MSGIIKKTKKTAADEARRVAKQMRQEPMELAKTIVPPHIIEGPKKNGSSPITEAILQDQEKTEDVGVGEISEEESQVKANKRLQELEEEIKKIRRDREAQLEQWKKNQEVLMKPQEPEEKPFVPPQGKKKRGFMSPAQKKKGTKEMGKQKT